MKSITDIIAITITQEINAQPLEIKYKSLSG